MYLKIIPNFLYFSHSIRRKNFFFVYQDFAVLEYKQPDYNFGVNPHKKKIYTKPKFTHLLLAVWFCQLFQ